MATNWKEYTTKTNPEDTDEIMIADTKANANKRTPLSGLWNWITGKLATAVISQLETQNKSIIPALNELNSNSFDSKTNSFYARGIQNIGEKNTITIHSNANEQCFFIMLAGAKNTYCLTFVGGIDSDSKVSHIDLLNEGVTFSGSSVNRSIIINSGNWSRGVIYSYRPFTVEIA